MHSNDATALAERLRNDTRGNPDVDNVEPRLINRYATDSLGYGARVFYRDGRHRDIIGSARAGYQFTDQALGWRSYDLLLAEEFALPAEPAEDEPTPADDADLVTKVRGLAVAFREASRILGEVADELVMRDATRSGR